MFERIISGFKNAWTIFKTSLAFIGRDKSLLVVPILMILGGIAFAISCVFVFVLVLPFAQSEIVIYVGYVIALFLFYLLMTFLGAAQSWMVHEVAQGKDTTFGSGAKRALSEFTDIILFALVTTVLRIILSALRQKARDMGGVGGAISGSAVGFLETIAGIAGKLVLPAMIITNRSFFDSLKQLRESTRAIPEIATYEVGIGPIQFLAFLAVVALSVVFGLLGGFIAGLVMFAVLVLALIILSVLVNQIYYTLLYLTLIERKKIPGMSIIK